MKLLLVGFLLFISSFAHGHEIPLRDDGAQELFSALAGIFGGVEEVNRYSYELFVVYLNCVSARGKQTCTGLSSDYSKRKLVAREGVKAESEANQNLNRLWEAMEKAGLPIKIKDGRKRVRISHVYCSHSVTLTEQHYYSCSYMP